MQLSPRIRKLLSSAAKLLLTGAALWLVFSKIDLSEVLGQLKTARAVPLLFAIALFILSKVISSFRLNTCFRQIGLHLNEPDNLKLYWLGMYYNLFLPGGIGGDGYKIYLLNKHYKTGVKPLTAAVLLDRLSGLAALAALTAVLLVFQPLPAWAKGGGLAGVVLLYLAYHLLVRRFFPVFGDSLFSTGLQSLGVQLAQAACAVLIMLALGISDHFLSYLLVFFISSMVAVLPLTIGGVGAREVVFLYGAGYLQLNEHLAVTLSLLFFLITAVVSLSGAWFSFKSPLPLFRPS